MGLGKAGCNDGSEMMPKIFGLPSGADKTCCVQYTYCVHRIDTVYTHPCAKKDCKKHDGAQNFEVLKNREDSSDFDDSWTV